MNNMSLLRKFLLMGGLLVLVVGAGSVVLTFGLAQIKRGATELSATEIPVLTRAHDLQLAVVQVQQFLTDVSATRGQNGLGDGFALAEENAQRFYKLLGELQQLDKVNAEKYAALRPTFDAYYATGKEMAKAYVAEGPSGGNKMMGQFDGVAERITSQVDEMLAGVEQHAHQRLAEENHTVSSVQNTMIIVLLVLLVVMVYAGYTLLQALGQLPDVVRELAQVGEGNLVASNGRAKSNDEIGQLFRGLDDMKQKLRHIVGEVSSSSGQLAASAEQTAAITEETERSVASQQQEVTQIVAAMTEMAATAQEVAQNAATAASSAQEADGEAQAGRDVVTAAIASTEQLARDIANVADAIHALEKESEDIGGILDVIRGIADQTNLLALNAAIEAARAGEQGRGFAVVADEVRTLASRTRESTQEIHSMIERLQSGARNAVELMTQGRERTEQSVHQAEAAGERLAAITKAVASISEMNLHIAAAAKEQSTVAEEMNKNIYAINTASEQTVAGARQNAVASHELERLAQELQRLVAHFAV